MQLIKKTTLLLLIIVFVVSIPISPVFAEDNTDIKAVTVEPLSGAATDRLYALGIITNEDISNGGERLTTRGEFAALIIRMLGMEPSFDSQIFDDVTEEHANAAYINTACRMNIVSMADKFYPDSQITLAEASKIILSSIGYDEVAQQSGGWPSGYTSTASKLGIIKGVSASNNINFSNAVRMIDNTLDVKVLDTDYNGSYKRSDGTVLSEYLRIDKISGQISEIFITKRQIRVISDGVSKIYDLADTLDPINIVEDEADIYVSTGHGDKNVLYIDYKGTVTVEYDYISEVNGSVAANEYQTKDIKKIRLSNIDKEYSMDSGARVTLNDADADTSSVVLIDAFAKVVLNSGRIVRLEAYSLYEGGIIYHSDPEMIKFIRGDVNNNTMQRLDTIDDLRIYIDGVRVDSMYRLKSDMLFDYYLSPDESKMIIVASSRIFTKSLISSGSNQVNLDGVEYKINPNTGLYVYSNSRSRYQKNTSLNTYLGKQVRAFVDDNMYLRYVKVSDDIEYSNSFAGVLMAVSQPSNPFSDDGRLKIFKITGGQGEKIYDIDESKMNKSPIKMDYLRDCAGSTEGKSFLRFTINSENRVVKVEPIDLWGNTTTFKGTVEKLNDGWLDSLYCKTATIFAGFVNDRGNFEVRVLDWEANMRDFTFTSPVTVISDYNPRLNPKPSFIMLGKGSESHRSRGAQTGIVEGISYIEDDKVQLSFSNMWGAKKYDVTNDFISSNGLKENLLIEWYYDLFGENSISIANKRDLSGEPDNWSVDNATYNSGITSGFYKADDILYRDEECAQFVVNGEPTDLFPLNEYVVVYEIVHSKNGIKIVQNTHEKPIGFISQGDNVWFHVVPWGPSPRSVDMIIYEKTSIDGN